MKNGRLVCIGNVHDVTDNDLRGLITLANHHHDPTTSGQL